MRKMMFVCTPGYPMTQGAVARSAYKASFVKASLGAGAHAIQLAQRERITAAAVITPVPVQTTDLPSDPSALTRERRT